MTVLVELQTKVNTKVLNSGEVPYLSLLLVESANQEKALEGASRGLLVDCEIFANLHLTFVLSSS